MKTRKVFGIRKKVVLNHSNSDMLFMESIGEKEEKLIDESLETFSSPRFILEKDIVVYPSNIYVYGKVDLDDNNDINLLMSKDIMPDSVMEAAIIPSNFNYEDGIIYSNGNNEFLYHNTWNKLNWFKYNYCLLGKPERIIIYKLNRIAFFNHLHNHRVKNYGDNTRFLFGQ